MSLESKSANAPNEEFDSFKKGFVSRLLETIRAYPDAKEYNSKNGENVRYQDVFNDDDEIKEEYSSWIHEKASTVFNVLK